MLVFFFFKVYLFRIAKDTQNYKKNNSSYTFYFKMVYRASVCFSLTLILGTS